MKKVQKSCSLFAFFKVVTSVVLLFTFELPSFSYSKRLKTSEKVAVLYLYKLPNAKIESWLHL